MDAHANEYLAAIAGMNAMYGDRSDEPQTERLIDREHVVVNEPALCGG